MLDGWGKLRGSLCRRFGLTSGWASYSMAVEIAPLRTVFLSVRHVMVTNPVASSGGPSCEAAPCPDLAASRDTVVQNGPVSPNSTPARRFAAASPPGGSKVSCDSSPRAAACRKQPGHASPLRSSGRVSGEPWRFRKIRPVLHLPAVNDALLNRCDAGGRSKLPQFVADLSVRCVPPLAEQHSSPAPAAQESYKFQKAYMRPVSGAAPSSASRPVPPDHEPRVQMQPVTIEDATQPRRLGRQICRLVARLRQPV
jgi:hypothetical protein